jgi:phage virion morphogenesis protein
VAEVKIEIDAMGMAVLNRRLNKLLQKTKNLEPVWEDAAEYMVRSTVNRILRTKTGPDGERWAALSDLTIQLKGHDRQLFESGDLYRSVHVEDVSKEGFAITADSDHASFMQDGVNTVRGKYRSKKPSPQVPARPFMGFSDQNVREISKMLREYLAEGGD